MASIWLIGVARGCRLGPKTPELFGQKGQGRTGDGCGGLNWPKWAGFFFWHWNARVLEGGGGETPGLWYVNAIANVPACKVCPNAF